MLAVPVVPEEQQMLPYCNSILSNLLPSPLDMDEQKWNAGEKEAVAICFANGLRVKSIEEIAKLLRTKCNGKIETRVHWHRTTNSFALYVSLSRNYEAMHNNGELPSTSSSKNQLAIVDVNDRFEPAEQIAMIKDLIYSARTNADELVKLEIDWDQMNDEDEENLKYIDEDVRPSSMTLTFPPGKRIVPFIQSTEPDSELPPLVQLVFPLHQENKLKWLRAGWVFASVFRLLTPPLDRIRAVFGSEIALYIAWLAHYTSWMCAASVAGALVAIYLSLTTSSPSKNVYAFVLFALFNTIWAINFVWSWSSRQKFLIAEMVQREGRRAEKDKEIYRPPPFDSSGEEDDDVELKRSSRYSSLLDWRLVPVDMFSLFGILIALVTLYWAQDRAEEAYGIGSWLVTGIITLQGLIYLGAEQLYRMALYKVGRKGVSVELQYEYDDGFVIRIILFNSISCFSLLFYIAFAKQNWPRLTETLATLLISRQLIQSLTEIGIPLLINWLYLIQHKITIDFCGTKRKSSLISMLASMSRAEKDAAKNDYDRPMDDYLEMYIQLGYILLFSSVFPLAALCALFNNLLEARVDAFKLCYVFRRPWPRSAQKIWVWQCAIRAMCYAGVFVNLALILIRFLSFVE